MPLLQWKCFLAAWYLDILLFRRVSHLRHSMTSKLKTKVATLTFHRNRRISQIFLSYNLQFESYFRVWSGCVCKANRLRDGASLAINFQSELFTGHYVPPVWNKDLDRERCSVCKLCSHYPLNMGRKLDKWTLKTNWDK